MQIPILNGVYTDTKGDFRTSYPRNLIPVVKNQGISVGYLRPADGIAELAEGPGLDRGAINWKGVCYRVLGSKLCAVFANGSINVIGDVGGADSQVSLDYSFDRLAVASNRNLFYWDGSNFSQVTDTDIGTVLDVVWVDGYFMTTDGSSLVVTELNNPFEVNPLKYGSAESDPDSILGLLKIREEVYAIGRYSIEVFGNVGGNLFPFQRIPGAQVMRGAIGTHAACVFNLSNYTGVAFVGSGKNEPPAVWFGVNGVSTSLSTREIETVLQTYSESDLSNITVEARIDKSQTLLYVHLPDQTLVYDANASAELKEPVWFVLTSSIVGNGTYRARNMVWCYNRWIVGDPTSNKLGYFVDSLSSHYGDLIGWEFGTLIVYNNSQGVIFHELELVALTGNVELGDDPTIYTCYSKDGKTWSQERPRKAGRTGKTDVRLNWLQQGNMKSWRIQKFRGTSDAHISIARLEARLEALNN